MSKRKPKRRRKLRPLTKIQLHRRPSIKLQRFLQQAERLINSGRALEAVDLLAPLLESYPRVADLHYYVGYAHIKAGDSWGGIEEYDQALELSRDPSYWLPLASLYLELELKVHALHAFRQALETQSDIPMVDEVRETVVSLEKGILETARHLRLPVAQVEKGLRYLEIGQRELQKSNFAACIAANQQAIKLLADWPPPHNNLSLALFDDGQPEKAIATARQVLSQYPDNVQALSNSIRFLAWTGQEAEARALWPRLKGITPQGYSERLKMAEAAAVLEQDESVYKLLKPLDRPDVALEGTSRFSWRTQLFLAIAEANTGRRAAYRRLKTLQGDILWAGDLLAALQARRPGPGWAERFPYFHSTELMPRYQIDEFVELIGREDEMSPQRFRSQIARFVARFPQIVLMAEKMIWEDGQPDAGVAILATIATPAAYAALRRFGSSQAGEDEARMQALSILMQAGEISQDETLRVWSEGEWRDVQVRQYEISDEPKTLYAPEVADLLEQGLQAFQQDDLERAARLFRRALTLDPRAKEACNNLGTIYARRGEHGRAREMYQEAVEIDSTYVFPRCNLAVYLLDEDDVEGAEAMLAPLVDVTRLHPQEMAFYSYTQAQVLIHKKEYAAARKALQMALQIWPGYEPAESLLERLETFDYIWSGFDSLFEQQRKRDQSKRAQLQTKLFTTAPSLSEALSLYTKNALTGMGRVILPWGGWSGLRKAELLQRIVEGLQDADNVERMMIDLHDQELDALRQVLAQGGYMSWQDFDAEYGNDLEESRYWEYHEPETIMGRLRLHGLLVEATVDGVLLVVVPTELRQILKEMLDL